MYSKSEIKKTKEIIIDKMTKGSSLKSILDGNKKLPSRPIIYKWLNSANKEFDEEFLYNYEKALQDRSDLLVEEIITIADNQENDVYTDDDGNEIINHNVIQRARLRVDARKWVAAKMQPKKYGDSSQIKIANHDGKELKVNAMFNLDLINVPTNESTK